MKVIAFAVWLGWDVMLTAISIARVMTLGIRIEIKVLAEVAARCNRVTVFTEYHFQKGEWSPMRCPIGLIINGIINARTNPAERYSMLNHLKYRLADPTTRSMTLQ